jgi:hypothetical protein
MAMAGARNLTGPRHQTLAKEYPMLTTILLVLAALIIGILIIAATKPPVFRVQRSTTINAPPEKIFPLINDFHNWGSWSPWEKLDPGMTRTHSGAGSGRGAVYAWEGNKKVGKGRMEIIETAPPSKVVVKLDFITPFEAHNTAEYLMDGRGSSTQVTWVMHGPNTYFGKVMSVFTSMDSMVGKDFEQGLANMKAVAERQDAVAGGIT